MEPFGRFERTAVVQARLIEFIDEHGNRLAYVSPASAWSGFRIHRIRTTDVFFNIVSAHVEPFLSN